MTNLSIVNDVSRSFSLQDLNQFHGTSEWYLQFFKWMVYTEGVKYLAEQTKCFWLIDDIAIYLPKVFKKYPDDFYTIKFIAYSKDNSGELWFEDGNDHVLWKVKIPYTDFPVKNEELKLFLARCDVKRYCLMVPSEY